MSSLEWTRLADVACLIGIAACLGSFYLHAQAALSPSGKRAGGNLFSRASVAALVAAAVLMGIAVSRRWVEVNHFPSQTMSEVVTMFSFALLVSMIVLRAALRLTSRGAAWGLLADGLLGLVLTGGVLIHVYVSRLSTAEKDLPPALQSYWFTPHLLSLILSYALLSIAALIVAIYFGMRFWSGVFVGGRSLRSQVVLFLILSLVPFLQVVGISVLVLSGLAFLALKFFGELPSKEAMAAVEKDFDEVSYSAFTVGIPFLTAGLFMGAFWAQEAWANYWGWDSKENSALVTWLVYVIYLHVRWLGGFRGEKAMAWLLGGAFSIFITFQLFGYLPDSQKSLHRYTDDQVVPKEGMQGPAPPSSSEQAP